MGDWSFPVPSEEANFTFVLEDSEPVAPFLRETDTLEEQLIDVAASARSDMERAGYSFYRPRTLLDEVLQPEPFTRERSYEETKAKKELDELEAQLVDIAAKAYQDMEKLHKVPKVAKSVNQ